VGCKSLQSQPRKYGVSLEWKNTTEGGKSKLTLAHGHGKSDEVDETFAVEGGMCFWTGHVPFLPSDIDRCSGGTLQPPLR
jgi:hypothetical protein